MRGSGALGGRGLGRADIKLAVHGDRIAVYDLAVKTFGERQRKRSLATRRRSQHDHEQRIKLRHSHRQRTLQ